MTICLRLQKFLLEVFVGQLTPSAVAVALEAEKSLQAAEMFFLFVLMKMPHIHEFQNGGTHPLYIHMYTSLSPWYCLLQVYSSTANMLYSYAQKKCDLTVAPFINLDNFSCQASWDQQDSEEQLHL